MSRRAPTVCSHPTCPKLTTKTYCRKHTKRDTRVNSYQRGYTKAWHARVKRAIAKQPYCSRCGATEDLTGDHPIPLDRGGSRDQEPVVLCRPCNSRKGARTA